MAYGKNIKEILYGGDYNPEQWTQEVWEEDMRLMKKAHINIVTLNTFSWAALQPSEDNYCFESLDKIMNFIRENGLKVCMATSTGAHPAWMAKRHPDILRTDFNGVKRKFGGRHNSSKALGMICGAASITVTSILRAAKFSATSSPINPAPHTTALRHLFSSA